MIDTVAIKGKIINLALQGKLSEHSDSDNDIEQQLSEILKKNKIDANISATELPFSIPSNWCWIRLGWAMNIDRGGSPRPIKAFITTKDDGINWIKIGDVAKDGKYITETKEKIKPEGEKKSRRVFPGDFLLTNSMSYGRPYISKIEGCIHDGWLVLRNTEEVFNLDFLYYFLSSTYAYTQFSKKASGSTVDNLNKEKVGDAIVPIPPIEEQQRIVAAIEEILPTLAAIDNLQARYVADRDVLKGKLIDAAICGKLTKQLPEDGTADELYQEIQEEKKRLEKDGKIKKSKKISEISKDEIPFEIPENWKWVRLDDITSKIASGSTPSGGRKSDVYVSSGYEFFREQNIYNDGIHNEGMVYITEELLSTRENSTVYARDILLNITGGSIGRCALIPEDFDKGSINQHILIIRAVNPEIRFYVHNFLCSPYALNYIKGNAVGDKDGFSGGRCKKMLIPMPPLAEQRRIVETLDNLLENM